MPRGHYSRKPRVVQVVEELQETEGDKLLSQQAVEISNLQAENKKLTNQLMEALLENNRIKEELLDLYRKMIFKS